VTRTHTEKRARKNVWENKCMGFRVTILCLESGKEEEKKNGACEEDKGV
jgi:hypothetical protein